MFSKVLFNTFRQCNLDEQGKTFVLKHRDRQYHHHNLFTPHNWMQSGFKWCVCAHSVHSLYVDHHQSHRRHHHHIHQFHLACQPVLEHPLEKILPFKNEWWHNNINN